MNTKLVINEIPYAGTFKINQCCTNVTVTLKMVATKFI